MEDFEFTVVKQPDQPAIHGTVYIRRGDREIFLERELAEWIAIELMQAYGLQWWPEPDEGDRSIDEPSS